MEDEDLQPRARLAADKPLEEYSVEELEAYGEALERELEQVRATLKGKRAYLSGAESLFKS
ncbi:DUF1192 family protein [Ferruginivarius sediminum]|nr:DUF1192 family protein [Ferruginivarius sediminum]